MLLPPVVMVVALVDGVVVYCGACSPEQPERKRKRKKEVYGRKEERKRSLAGASSRRVFFFRGVDRSIFSPTSQFPRASLRGTSSLSTTIYTDIIHNKQIKTPIFEKKHKNVLQ